MRELLAVAPSFHRVRETKSLILRRRASVSRKYLTGAEMRLR
jgi:hypothetical protein